MICGYHNYAASDYVIRYEHACSALSRYLSRNYCQKSATDVELKLLTVIPDAHCSSYESRARQRAWSAVETTEINATYIFYVSFRMLLATESPAASSVMTQDLACVWPKNIWFVLYE